MDPYDAFSYSLQQQHTFLTPGPLPAFICPLSEHVLWQSADEVVQTYPLRPPLQPEDSTGAIHTHWPIFRSRTVTYSRRSHGREKLHICKDCPFSTTRTYRYKEHRRAHREDPARRVCNFCWKSFGRWQDVDRHINSVGLPPGSQGGVQAPKQ
jgi:hypothetical protein